jgi:hypothetical protein
MSFHFSFVARSVEDARAKLEAQHAPAAVKAVIESALDTMPVPQPTTGSQVNRATVEGRDQASSPSSSSRWSIGFFGVSVEASGHVGGGYAQISKLEVRPLVS